MASGPTHADFTIYAGNVSQQTTWQTALGGNVPIENFDSFSGVPNTSIGGDMLAALPSVHVIFDPIVPGVYDDAQWAHSGTEQWSNWAGGAGNSSSHTLRPDPGRQIVALGFWNCDPQGDQPMLAYDVGRQLIGTIAGHLNTHNSHPELSDGFAGFISSTPIAYVKIPGQFGDGWNHFDDLLVVTQVTADYNHNGIVDAGDYVVWRATLNQTGTNLQADGSGPTGIPNGVVDSYDCDFWRANFGKVVGVAAGTGSSIDLLSAVPEASTLLLCSIGVAAYIPFRSSWQSSGRQHLRPSSRRLHHLHS